MPQLKTKKNRIIEDNKYDEYEKIAKYKQECHCCATYDFDYQTIESILDLNIIKARKEQKRRQKRELIELSNEEFS